MRRLCIYLTYDKQGTIDTYIGYMLKELKTCADALVVVCNENKISKGLNNLEPYADRIYYRENIGFDAGGFKDALCNLLGWEYVLAFDELALVNDSIFGPFRPMAEIFAEMKQQQVDFWGLAMAEYGACKNNYGKDVPEHIQSYFMVIRFSMLHSREFKEYWENMPYYTVFSELFREYEFKFTQYFYDLGYSYSALADTKANDSNNIVNNYCQYAAIPYELIERRNFPFLKKQQIGFDVLDMQTQEQIRLAIDYIGKNTVYDVNLIWENLIRTLDVSDLQRNLCLRYVIQPERNPSDYLNRTAVIVFAEQKESIGFVLEYLWKIPLSCNIKIFSLKKDIIEIYKTAGLACEEICINTRESLLDKLSSFDFVCILHDADITSEKRPSCTGKSYFYSIWENMLKDKEYIHGIINLFLKENRLGLLVPPQPHFAEYFGELGKGWNGKYEKARMLVETLGLSCQMSESKAPFRVSSNIWIRGSILKSLKSMKTDDYQYLPYMWSYIAQAAGYYSGIVESADYAAMNEINLQYYLNQITNQIRRQYGGFENFFEMKKKIFNGALSTFCGKHHRLLIYGTGYIARMYKDMLPGIEAFVVSDGRKKENELDGIPVKYLSEVSERDKYGFVLCLDEKNQMEVIPLLKKYGIKNYICT